MKTNIEIYATELTQISDKQTHCRAIVRLQLEKLDFNGITTQEMINIIRRRFKYINDKGEFNVPYGGISYNHKLMQSKVDYYHSPKLLEHFAKTTIENLDFLDFFRKHNPTEKDFVFLDPPYDTEFSTYAQNEFTQADQKRLADYLCEECKAKWQLVIKYTPFIYSLYDRKGIIIQKFDKKYLVSFMNRNDKDVEHLIITNYKDKFD